MKLETGKRYVRRDGHITGPLKHKHLGGDGYTFSDPTTGFDYTNGGNYWSTGEEDEQDLVREYIEPQAAKPHKHADLLRALADDSEARLWKWYYSASEWNAIPEQRLLIGLDPDEIVAVSRTKPTEPPVVPRKQITLAGRTFDAPLTEAPKVGEEVWSFDYGMAFSFRWENSAANERCLFNRAVHSTETAACAHAKALIELTKQAIENAK